MRQRLMLARLSLARVLLRSMLHALKGSWLMWRRFPTATQAEKNALSKQWARECLRIFNVELDVQGEPQVEGPLLVVSNHISWLDIPVLGSGARVFFLAKAEIENWPIFGKLAKGGGTLFIQRGSGDSIRIKEQITDFLKQDIPVLFFPEATTTDGTKVKKVHGRLLGAAIDAQRPVQICLICYVNNHGELDNVAPYIGNISFTEHVTRVLKMPKVIAHLKALPQIDVTGHSVESLTHEVQEKMQQGLQQLQQQVLKQMPKNS